MLTQKNRYWKRESLEDKACENSNSAVGSPVNLRKSHPEYLWKKKSYVQVTVIRRCRIAIILNSDYDKIKHVLPLSSLKFLFWFIDLIFPSSLLLWSHMRYPSITHACVFESLASFKLFLRFVNPSIITFSALSIHPFVPSVFHPYP
jgi:hypothetical protein